MKIQEISLVAFQVQYVISLENVVRCFSGEDGGDEQSVASQLTFAPASAERSVGGRWLLQQCELLLKMYRSRVR